MLDHGCVKFASLLLFVIVLNETKLSLLIHFGGILSTAFLFIPHRVYTILFYSIVADGFFFLCCRTYLASLGTFCFVHPKAELYKYIIFVFVDCPFI